MLLQYLIEDLEDKEVIGNTNIDVGKVEYDSSKIQKDDVFVAIKGFEFDGNDFLEEVIKKGAVCIVIEKDKDISAIQNIIAYLYDSIHVK